MGITLNTSKDKIIYKSKEIANITYQDETINGDKKLLKNIDFSPLSGNSNNYIINIKVKPVFEPLITKLYFNIYQNIENNGIIYNQKVFNGYWNFQEQIVCSQCGNEYSPYVNLLRCPTCSFSNYLDNDTLYPLVYTYIPQGTTLYVNDEHNCSEYNGVQTYFILSKSNYENFKNISFELQQVENGQITSNTITKTFSELLNNSTKDNIISKFYKVVEKEDCFVCFPFVFNECMKSVGRENIKSELLLVNNIKINNIKRNNISISNEDINVNLYYSNEIIKFVLFDESKYSHKDDNMMYVQNTIDTIKNERIYLFQNNTLIDSFPISNNENKDIEYYLNQIIDVTITNDNKYSFQIPQVRHKLLRSLGFSIYNSNGNFIYDTNENKTITLEGGRQYTIYCKWQDKIILNGMDKNRSEVMNKIKSNYYKGNSVDDNRYGLYFQLNNLYGSKDNYNTISSQTPTLIEEEKNNVGISFWETVSSKYILCEIDDSIGSATYGKYIYPKYDTIMNIVKNNISVQTNKPITQIDKEEHKQDKYLDNKYFNYKLRLLWKFGDNKWYDITSLLNNINYLWFKQVLEFNGFGNTELCTGDGRRDGNEGWKINYTIYENNLLNNKKYAHTHFKNFFDETPDFYIKDLQPIWLENEKNISKYNNYIYTDGCTYFEHKTTPNNIYEKLFNDVYSSLFKGKEKIYCKDLFGIVNIKTNDLKDPDSGYDIYDNENDKKIYSLEVRNINLSYNSSGEPILYYTKIGDQNIINIDILNDTNVNKEI